MTTPLPRFSANSRYEYFDFNWLLLLLFLSRYYYSNYDEQMGKGL